MSRRRVQSRADKQRKIEEAERARKRRSMFTAIGAAAAIAVVVGLITLAAASGEDGGDSSGTATQSGWDLPALQGDERIALADFSGSPTVAVFFASWCDVCEREMPGFIALSDQIGDQVSFVGINSQDSGRGLGDARKWGIDTRWPLARDIGGSDGRNLSVNAFGARGMPLTVVYDQHGTVVEVIRGGVSGDALLSILTREFGIT
ncbi:TlpA family protein disulfide reductase [bacterium]|nr:TlpA family protein disulfide reductase [bacterium]